MTEEEKSTVTTTPETDNTTTTGADNTTTTTTNNTDKQPETSETSNTTTTTTTTTENESKDEEKKEEVTTTTTITTTSTPVSKKEAKSSQEEKKEAGSRNESFSQPPPFDWAAYLTKTQSRAAPQSCFAQWPDPPQNEFRAGYKCETIDPRNTSSRCIATVIECQGPRLRLRLDGTDDRNDFWLMCDSELLYPWDPAHAQGRHISPPLGFGFELSRWQRFMHKLIETTPSDQFAPASCFRPGPARPSKNEFQIGDKLEAVDPKNPQLICPATVRELKHDRILVSFDGWSISSQFWAPITSRDLFPCGWCERASHFLQPLGDLISDDSSTTTAASTLTTTPGGGGSSSRRSQANSSTPSLIPTATSSAKRSTPSVSAGKKPSQKKPIADKNTTTTTTTKSTKSAATKRSESPLSTTPIAQPSKAAPRKRAQTASSPSSAGLNSSSTSTSSMSPSIVSPSAAKSPRLNGDLSVGSKPPLVASPKPVSNGKAAVTTPQTAAANINKQVTTVVKIEPTEPPVNENRAINVTVYVNPNVNLGVHINSQKYHRHHAKFGPGPPSTVYKSILLSFYESALSQPDMFRVIPKGKSSDFIRLKTGDIKTKKQLVEVTSEKDLWTELGKMCKKLALVTSEVFSSQPFPASHSRLSSSTTTTTTTAPLNNIGNLNGAASSESAPAPITNGLLLPHKPIESSQPAAAIITNGSTTSTTTSVPAKRKHVDNDVINGFSTTPISASKADEHDGSKIINGADSSFSEAQKFVKLKKLADSNKGQSTKKAVEWTVDEVIAYVGELSDRYFAAHTNMFRHHEIDGKALLLLTTDVLVKYMGFKLGPALKLNNYLDKLRSANNVVLNSKPPSMAASASSSTTSLPSK